MSGSVHEGNGTAGSDPFDDLPDQLDLEHPDEQVDAMTRDEVRRRAEAPLPRSLLDFLR